MPIANKGKTILLVEDEVTLLSALRDKFSREGFTIFEAKNGQEGLNSAFANHPDLILLDIIMPVMDGMTVLKKLRAGDQWGKTVPVIILTNLNEGKKVSESLAYGTDEYLVKSDWKIEDIVKKVKEKLKIEM